MHVTASTQQPLLHLALPVLFLVPTADAFAGEATITGAPTSHEALTPLQCFAAAPRPTSGFRNTDGQHAMYSNTATSSVFPNHQDIVGDVAPPQGGTEVRRPSANHGIAFAVLGNYSRGEDEVVELPRENTNLACAPRGRRRRRDLSSPGGDKSPRGNWQRCTL